MNIVNNKSFCTEKFIESCLIYSRRMLYEDESTVWSEKAFKKIDRVDEKRIAIHCTRKNMSPRKSCYRGTECLYGCS